MRQQDAGARPRPDGTSGRAILVASFCYIPKPATGGRCVYAEKINIFKRIPSEFIVFLFLLALCFILYAPSLKADFVLDDNVIVVQNPTIKQVGLYPQIFSKSFFNPYKSSPDFKLSYYRPVTLSSLALDYRIWELRPWGYRITNILLHILNGLLVFRLVKMLFKVDKIAFLAAVFFCILPIHEGVVNNIVGRADLLQAFFLLGSTVCLVDHLEKRNFLKLTLSILFFIAAILSREVALVYPLLVILLCSYYDRHPRRIFKDASPFLMTALAYYVIRLSFLPIVNDNLTVFLSFDKIFQWLVTVAQYSIRFVFPWSAQTLLKFSFASLGLKMLVFYSGVLILAMAILFERKNRPQKKQWIFGLGWILITMMPFLIMSALIKKMGPYFSESFLYFSSVGFAIVLSCIIFDLRKSFRYGILIFFVSYYIVFTIYNNSFWGSEKDILTRVFRTEQSYDHIAGMQILMKYEDNEVEINKIIARKNDPVSKSMWLKRLGSIYRKKKDYPRATRLFKDAIKLNPGSVEAHNELAAAYLETGETEEGIRYLQESLALDDQYAETYRILGQVFYQQNNFTGAVENLSKAYYYNPDDMEALLYLAMAHFFNKQDAQYAKWMDVLIRKFGNTRSIVRFVANELYRHGYFRQVVRVIEDSKNLFADDAQMFIVLSRAYSYTGQEHKATDTWERARAMKSFASVTGNK